jgi:branched-chain amino acid transport system ATP-binding protein
MDDLIRVKNLSKAFGAFRAVDGVSFELKKGQALGILGPNGAGKSTLFNLISGDERPTEGAIFLDAREITNLPAYVRCHLGIGRSYQIPRPFGGMSVFENLLVAATYASGKSEAACQDWCIEVLRRTGLLRKVNVAARRLTLLERKRLELARALATQPKILLLDEIAGGLTEGECHSLVETIRDVMSTGISIIWIEHIVHALLSVVTRLIVMNFGTVLAEGDPQTVVADPVVQEVYLGIEAE